MSGNDSTQKTILVALVLCLVCSILVATAAVMLRPAQQANKALDKKTNILAAAGLLNTDVSIEEQFEAVSTRVVDINSGKFSDAVDPAVYDQRKAAKDPALSTKLSAENDLAKIGSQENYALV